MPGFAAPPTLGAMRRPLPLAVVSTLLGSLSGCAVGDDTVFVDDAGSQYGAEVFCADTFEGIRVSMVPGPGLVSLPADARGCVRLFFAQTTQGTYDVSVNESFVLTGGTLEAKPDCRVGADFVGTATAAAPLTAATGAVRFEGGPEGQLGLQIGLEFGDVDLDARIDEVDVRRGGCDANFD